MSNCYKKFIDVIDGQWMINIAKTNGGDIVAFRSLWVGTLLIIATIGLQALIDPQLHGPISWKGFLSQLTDLGAISGAIYAGTYAAFYARFVSQWSYLANLYNQIKQAETAACAQSPALAQWKAGYIEDAETLHLMRKRSIAPVVRAWAEDDKVIQEYSRHTPGGLNRLSRIKAIVEKAYLDFDEAENKNNHQVR
ncbi:hypothetical protein [Comamonas sp.]|uniref:hypothetical protein n=1 Tax=Comamonas sp. TaxID=34028 RepID=UPI003D12CB80